MKYYGHRLVLIIYMTLPQISPRTIPMPLVYIYIYGNLFLPQAKLAPHHSLVFYTPYDAANYTAEAVLDLSST